MKKHASKAALTKLTLDRETLAEIAHQVLQRIAGGDNRPLPPPISRFPDAC